MKRDLLGYGQIPPHPGWPENARVAVSFVVNVEEGAELSVADGDCRNEGTYEVQAPVDRTPDYCMSSHFDYGTRVAWWRVMDLLDSFGVPATLNICGRSAQRAPWLVKDGVERGHEPACHGWLWEPHAGMNEEKEREAIDRTVDAIAAAGGVTPVGWHTRSSPSVNTRRLLIERGTFLYDSDYYGDDLPLILDGPGRPHVVLPYAFDTNDMHFHQGLQRFVFGDDFARYVCDAFDWLWREGETAPKMMSVGLHLRMIGRPGRIAGLEAVLKHMTAKGGAWFARRDAIARHWLALTPSTMAEAGT